MAVAKYFRPIPEQNEYFCSRNAFFYHNRLRRFFNAHPSPSQLNAMRIIFRKLGRPFTVILITALSVLFSAVLTILICTLSGLQQHLPMLLPIALFIPFVVAPLISWPVMGVLIKIDTLELEMRDLATYDFLTGLLSRQAFFYDAANYINWAEREELGFSVLAIDLDKFKKINDQYGHPAGDEVLKQFAESAQTVFRKTDLIGRIGGEEFAIFLPNTTTANALDLAERIRLGVQNSTVQVEDLLIKYTVSIGLVSSSGNPMSIEEILQQADQALYLAKKNGRNSTVIFDTEQNPEE